MVKGIILAGGEGRRLRPALILRPKVHDTCRRDARPLLEYIIRLFCHHDITDVTMLVGYKHEQIVNYFGNGSRFGVELTYCQDEPDVKGTGAALLNLCNKGPVDPEETILVYYGDILSNIDLASMARAAPNDRRSRNPSLGEGIQYPRRRRRSQRRRRSSLAGPRNPPWTCT